MLPSEFACGETFSSNHALSFPKGLTLIVRHNGIRDQTVGLLKEEGHNVGPNLNFNPSVKRNSPSQQPITTRRHALTIRHEDSGKGYLSVQLLVNSKHKLNVH